MFAFSDIADIVFFFLNDNNNNNNSFVIIMNVSLIGYLFSVYNPVYYTLYRYIYACIEIDIYLFVLIELLCFCVFLWLSTKEGKKEAVGSR